MSSSSASALIWWLIPIVAVFGAIIYGDQINGEESALALRATLSYPITIASISVKAGVSIGQIFHDHNVFFCNHNVSPRGRKNDKRKKKI